MKKLNTIMNIAILIALMIVFALAMNIVTTVKGEPCLTDSECERVGR